MVKKHSTKNKILLFFLSRKKEQFTIRSISKNIAVDYKTVYLVIQDLIKANLIIAKKIGQTILCSLNHRNFNQEIFTAEYLRRKIILKNKNLAVLHNDIASMRKPFLILLLFGSHASGKATKKSDIDLMLIVNDEETRNSVRNKLKLLPLNIHLLDFTTDEYLSMIKTTDFNVGQEAFYNNVILHGIENFYNLIQNG
jgi:predicted nucleotidyltransferase/predicted transcriptional regulator